MGRSLCLTHLPRAPHPALSSLSGHYPDPTGFAAPPLQSLLHCTKQFYEVAFEKGLKMYKTMTRMLAATAALSLATAPIVAHANTRAGDTSFAVAASAPGLGRADVGEGQNEKRFGNFFLAAGAVALAVVGALIAAGVIGDDDDDCVSPGACG